MEIVYLEIRSSFLPLGRRMGRLEEVEGSEVLDLCWEVPETWRLELRWGRPDLCSPVLISRSRTPVEEVGPPSHALAARISPDDSHQPGERPSLRGIHTCTSLPLFESRL